MNRRYLICTAMTLSAAFAQEQKRPAPQPGAFMRQNVIMAALDTDKDAIISTAEMEAAPNTILKLDRDRDGLLSAEELRPPIQGDMSADDMVQSLLAFDRNGDEKLTRKEVPERMRGLFERGDLDKNGLLDRGELTKVAFSLKFPAGRPVTEAPGPVRIDQIIAALDPDGDGKVSADELAKATAGVKTLDKNGDGRIVEDEVRPIPPPRKTEGPNH